MSGEATHKLRHQLLRPHQDISEVAFPGDDDPATGHFAAVRGADAAGSADIIGVATVVHQAPATIDAPDPSAWWRLRGMATVEHHRHQGVGSALAAAAVAHVAAHDGSVLWCNARLPAVAFYRRVGFATTGEPWEEPSIGPHVVMWRSVPRP